MLGRWGIPKVWKSELQKLHNEVLRRPKALPEASWRPEGPIGTLWGRSLGALGSLLGAPGSLWGEVLGALGDPGDGFWMIFWVRGACQCKNTKNLELDDHLHGFAMFLGSQGLGNEVEMVPETRKESREERKEQRRERRERHRGEKCSILVTVCVSRVPGRGGPPPNPTPPTDPELLSRGGFMRVWPQNRLFRLGFGLIRDFSENTSP